MAKKNTDAIDLLKKSFDKIYTTSVSITKEYNSEYIPLNTLYTILTKSKVTKNKEIKDFHKAYNNTIDVLYKCCKDWCDKNDIGTRMPLTVLQVFINQIKNNL